MWRLVLLHTRTVTPFPSRDSNAGISLWLGIAFHAERTGRLRVFVLASVACVLSVALTIRISKSVCFYAVRCGCSFIVNNQISNATYAVTLVMHCFINYFKIMVAHFESIVAIEKFIRRKEAERLKLVFLAFYRHGIKFYHRNQATCFASTPVTSAVITLSNLV